MIVRFLGHKNILPLIKNPINGSLKKILLDYYVMLIFLRIRNSKRFWPTETRCMLLSSILIEAFRVFDEFLKISRENDG